jgi:hypothetical protein
MAKVVTRYRKGFPPATPGPIPGVPLYDPLAFGPARAGSLHTVAHVAPGLGDSVASFIYSALGQGLAAARAATTTGGSAMASLFTGGGASLGSTDWGSLIGGIGQAVAGIYATKAQTRQLKQLNRLMGTRSLVPTAAFAPATVPAASGGLGGLGGLLGGMLGGMGAGLLPDINLPGGLEEGGTGLFGPDLFAPTQAGARQRMIDAPHPTTGERVYWRPVGRPIMFAGDKTLLLRTRKLVRKVSSAAGCGVAGGRFRRRRR